MIKINLNPEEKKKEKKLKIDIKLSEFEFSNYVYLGIFLIAVLCSLGYSFYLSYKIDELYQNKQKLVQEKQKYQKVAMKIRRLNKQISYLKEIINKLENRKLVYEILPSEKKLFLNMLSILSRSLPDGVWLRSIKLSRKKSYFEGFSFKPEYISNFYDNLSGYYLSVDFSSVQKLNNNVNEYYTFKFSLIDFKLENKGE